MKGFIAFLGKLDRGLTSVIKWMTIVLFLVIGLIVVANIILRVLPFTSLHWADEIVELSFAWMVFFGAAGVWMIHGHFSVGDWIGALVKGERGKHACRLVLELVSLLFVLVFFKYSLGLALRTGEATSVFQIPKKVLYACMPASTLIMVAYSIACVARHAIGMASPKALEGLEPPKD
jgi:TRAP-type C4-dicarboxylate transport system permease small subunit